jgi:hypothetical protein
LFVETQSGDPRPADDLRVRGGHVTLPRPGDAAGKFEHCGLVRLERSTQTRFLHRNLPNASNGVTVQSEVPTDDGDVFDNRLCDDESIERIAMMKRQIGQGRGMLRLDRHEPEAIIENGLLDEFAKRDMQRVLLDADLDGNLSVACRTDEDRVAGILNGGSSRSGEFWIVKVKPEQHVRIQQHVHGMYSAKSFRCSSSSP